MTADLLLSPKAAPAKAPTPAPMAELRWASDMLAQPLISKTKALRPATKGRLRDVKVVMIFSFLSNVTDNL
jgi:hypothetical protein